MRQDCNLIGSGCAAHLNTEGSLTFTACSGGRPDGASGAIIGNAATDYLVEGQVVAFAPKTRANAVARTWTPKPLWRDIEEAELEKTGQRFAKHIPLVCTCTP